MGFYEGVAGRVGRLRTTHGPHAVFMKLIFTPISYFAGRRRVPCVTDCFFEAPDDLFRFFCFDGTAACPLAIRFAVGLCELNVL